MDESNIINIYSANFDRDDPQTKQYSNRKTGFPSPAEDHLEKPLSLDDHLIHHPAATYFVRVEGDGLNDIGIFSEDILVVDRSLSATSGNLIVAVLEGEMVIRKFFKKRGSHYLARNTNFKNARKIMPETNFEPWGVVSYAVHKYI